VATLLLIADGPWVRNEVMAALADSSVLLEETDPRRAAARVADDRPDAVIIDMQVGSMGGMAIVRELLDAAGLDHVPRTPTILLLDRSADVFLAGRAGADAFLEKPLVAEELRTALRTVMNPQQGAATTADTEG
jgi:DNA-binding NarL/FixJ family response regulator